MRKIIVSEHISCDGFLAGPNGEMDWIKFDDQLFDRVGVYTAECDTALYGRTTYQMMEDYWPNAGNKPNATRHDIEHSNWYNNVEKIVLSKSMRMAVKDKTTFISENISDEILKIKQKPGKGILVFGSPQAVHSLMEYDLIDEYWLFVNPILLGNGIPLFANITAKTKLKLITTKVFHCGVIGLNYVVEGN